MFTTEMITRLTDWVHLEKELKDKAMEVKRESRRAIDDLMSGYAPHMWVVKRNEMRTCGHVWTR